MKKNEWKQYVHRKFLKKKEANIADNLVLYNTHSSICALQVQSVFDRKLFQPFSEILYNEKKYLQVSWILWKNIT